MIGSCPRRLPSQTVQRRWDHPRRVPPGHRALRSGRTRNPRDHTDRRPLRRPTRRRGFSVAIASLFGTPGDRHQRRALGVIAKACVSREFHVLATRDSSPATAWLRALARDLHETPRRPRRRVRRHVLHRRFRTRNAARRHGGCTGTEPAEPAVRPRRCSEGIDRLSADELATVAAKAARCSGFASPATPSSPGSDSPP